MVTDEGMVPAGSFSMTWGRTEAMSVSDSTVRRNWPLRLWNLSIMFVVVWCEMLELVVVYDDHPRCSCRWNRYGGTAFVQTVPYVCGVDGGEAVASVWMWYMEM